MSLTEALQARTLWIGELEENITEEFIEKRLLELDIPVKSIKIIKNRVKNISMGYGFIEFFSQIQAEKTLNDLNNKIIFDKNKTFKLNWASDSASKIACFTGLPKNEYTIYIGELDINVTEDELKNIFSQYYESVSSVKIIIDPSSKTSKGYGFVRFSNQNDYEKSIKEMNYYLIRGKHIKVK